MFQSYVSDFVLSKSPCWYTNTKDQYLVLEKKNQGRSGSERKREPLRLLWLDLTSTLEISVEIFVQTSN